MLQKYGTIDGIYAHLADDEKLRKKFGPFKKDADLSCELVTLERNVPVMVPSLEALAIPEEEPPLEEYFTKMGFASLMKRIGKEAASKKEENDSKNKQQSMF